MTTSLYLFLSLCVFRAAAWSDNKQRKFKDDFKFGVSTAAYQIEGAWNVDGKGENIWDRYFHTNPQVKDVRSGDVACNSYYNYKRDVQLLRELGVDYYRFSISWARVMPSGFPNDQNQLGFEYYDNLIDELLKYNIKPMITLYHFDLPQKLQDLGGWVNPLSSYWFEDYARVIFNRYADRVDYWITVNQPNSICMFGYGDTMMAPAVNAKGVADYECTKNVLLAHAKAYRLYEKEFKNKHKGLVGISMSLNWADPVDNSTENEEATEIFRDFNIGLFLDPIWSKSGDFPAGVKQAVAKKSKAQGFFRSRLPTLTPEEIKLIKGSADFLGVNHYTTFLVKSTTNSFNPPSFFDDIGVDMIFNDKWQPSESFWLRSAPYGLYKLCLYLNKRYDYPVIYITENGWSTKTGLWDHSRVENMRQYLKALLFAIEDGTQVKSFTVWGLMDNIEWVAGTSERFGLYEVDFDSEQKTRTARMSALVYKRIIEKRVVEEDWEPKDLNISPQIRDDL